MRNGKNFLSVFLPFCTAGVVCLEDFKGYYDTIRLNYWQKNQRRQRFGVYPKYCRLCILLCSAQTERL